MKNWGTAIAFWLLLTVGITAITYPFAMNYYNNWKNVQVEEEYNKEIINLDNKDELIAEARAFNEAKGIGYTMEDYYKLLKTDRSDVLAVLTIDGINLNLPVYHGHSEEVLLKGVGHMEDTDLPLGGPGSHTVLSGHSGLPDQKMFDDVNKLKEGDLIKLKVLGDNYVYKVFRVEVIDPKDYNDLAQPVKERELLSLVTCTPYSINTHRFIATAELVNVETDTNLGTYELSIAELLKWLIPYTVSVGAVTFLTVRMIRKG